MLSKLEELIQKSKQFQEHDVDVEWEKFVNKSGYSRKSSKIESSNAISMWKKIVVAASLILTISIGSYYWFQELPNPSTLTIETLQSKEIIELTDGSTIVLNEKSSITYPYTFENKETRTVNLNGSATFDIAKNLAKPFIVIQDGIAIKVLGTIFEIKKSSTGNAIEIENIEGKISVFEVADETNSIILEKGDRMRYENGVIEALGNRYTSSINSLDLLDYLMQKYDGKIYPRAYMPMDDSIVLQLNLDLPLNKILKDIDGQINFIYKRLPCQDCYEILKMTAK